MQIDYFSEYHLWLMSFRNGEVRLHSLLPWEKTEFLSIPYIDLHASDI